jgi:hypothetical protein
VSKNRQKPGRAKQPRYVPSSQQVAGSPGPTFDAMGKTWRLGFNDQNAKGALEELIRASVVRREDATARTMGEEAGQEYWDKRVQPKLDANYYATFKPGWTAVMKSEDGIYLFLQSLLVKNHPGVSALDAKRMFLDSPRQVIAALEVVAPDFFTAVSVEMGADPNDARIAAPSLAAALHENFAVAMEELDKATAREPATP